MNHARSIRPWLAAAALGAVLPAQGLHSVPPAALTVATQPPATVLFDQPGDGRIWAVGSTYKASFGADGFTYVPFLGSAAPRNYPVQFTLRAVRVGGQDLPLAADAAASRSGARVTFDRGAVREIYDLAPTQVEQTFAVAADRAGDVEVELEIVTDLVEDAARAGVQFGNALGRVEYGTAYLVQGESKTEIPAMLAGRTLRLQVPAAQRGAGAVVIDPVINTVTLTPVQMFSEFPEISYDASTDRWITTWVHAFSQTDRDVVAELRTAAGDAVAGSFTLIDATTEIFTSPHAANLNGANRFLIAMERYRPANPVGQQYSIWGRTMDAPSPFVTSSTFVISPNSNLNQHSVDVGGDPGTGNQWLVVWVHGETDILGRLVDANGGVNAVTIPIETTTASCSYPQVSPSNGNGLTPNPRWCVTYHQQNSATSWDACGAVIDLNGTITRAHRRLTNTGKDIYCNVTSPLVDVGTGLRFLVADERQEASSELVVRVVDSNLDTVSPEVNLTRRYGFSGTFSRVDCDGSRFAAVCHVGGFVRVGTLALVNNDIVLHEALQTISGGSYPNVVSKRTAGGGSTDYGIIFLNAGNPARTALSLYQGRAPAGGFLRRSTSCGLGINYSGLPFVGQTIDFALTNTGSDVAGLLLGLPMPAVTFCANCRLGVDLAQTMIALPSSLSLPLPRDPLFVGAVLAVQGFAAGSGPCPVAALRFSDTIDFTIQ